MVCLGACESPPTIAALDARQDKAVPCATKVLTGDRIAQPPRPPARRAEGEGCGHMHFVFAHLQNTQYYSVFHCCYVGDSVIPVFSVHASMYATQYVYVISCDAMWCNVVLCNKIYHSVK